MNEQDSFGTTWSIMSHGRCPHIRNKSNETRRPTDFGLTTANSRSTLNKTKCEFGVHTVKFLGHIIDCSKGLRVDPARLKAIQNLEQPKNISELCRFMGDGKPIGKIFTASFRDKPTFERAVEYEMPMVTETSTRASIHKNQR